MAHTVEYSVGSRRGSVSVKDGDGWGERLADAVAMEARRACIAYLSGLPHGYIDFGFSTPEQVADRLEQMAAEIRASAREGK